MKPLSLEDIFAIYEPLTYDFLGAETKALNRDIATVTLDNPCEECLTMKLYFNGILNSSANYDADVTFNFQLFKIDENNGSDVLLAPFIIQQQFSGENLSNHIPIMFEYQLTDDLIRNPVRFRLKLNSIQVDTVVPSVQIGISGTIVGVVLPN